MVASHSMNAHGLGSGVFEGWVKSLGSLLCCLRFPKGYLWSGGAHCPLFLLGDGGGGVSFTISSGIAVKGIFLICNIVQEGDMCQVKPTGIFQLYAVESAGSLKIIINHPEYELILAELNKCL